MVEINGWFDKTETQDTLNPPDLRDNKKEFEVNSKNILRFIRKEMD